MRQRTQGLRGRSLKPSPGLLLVIGEREALAWILRGERMAFTPSRAREARALSPGQRLFLYTTRGCFHNPTRDRGRVIAAATVATCVEELAEPLELGGRTFTTGCRLKIPQIAPLHGGIELAPLVSRLESLPTSTGWKVRLRRTLVPLTASDVCLIEKLLAPELLPRKTALGGYVAAARPGGRL